MRFVTAATAKGHDVDYGIRTAIAAALVSPHFLFRIERNGDPNDPSKSIASPTSNSPRG
jgi:hypothetical protein